MRTESGSFLRILIGVAAVALTLVAMHTMAQLINMILLGLVLAICFMPLMDWMQRRGAGRGASMILTSLILVVGGFGLLIFVFFSFGRLLVTLPQYGEDLAARVAGLGISAADLDLAGSLNLAPEQVVATVAGLLAQGVEIIFLVGFTMIISVFMLWERLLLPEKVRAVFKPDSRVVRSFQEFSRDVRGFVVITAKTALISSTGDLIMLLILGVDFAVLWAVLSFILSYIPSLGFILSVIPPMIMAFVQFGWEQALIVLLGYWLINGVVENFVKPRFIGVGLNLSPLVVFLSLVVWGWVLGLMGALLSVPVTLVLYRFLIQPRASTRWTADMMLYRPVDPAAPDAAADTPAADTPAADTPTDS